MEFHNKNFSYWIKRKQLLLILSISILLSSCFSYSFSGGNIPPEVNYIYIPYFSDRTNSGQATLSEQLYRSVINQFINQSRLQLSKDEINADVTLTGSLITYRNSPFSITGEEISSENRVEIVVKAVYKYKNEKKPVYDKTFNGFSNYSTLGDPVAGEQEAITEALNQISRKLFDDAVGQW